MIAKASKTQLSQKTKRSYCVQTAATDVIKREIIAHNQWSIIKSAYYSVRIICKTSRNVAEQVGVCMPEGQNPGEKTPVNQLKLVVKLQFRDRS